MAIITQLVPTGKMNRRVTLRSLADGFDEERQPIKVPSVLASGVSVYREDMDSRDRSTEDFKAGQYTARLETQFVMPYRADMDPEAVDVAATRDVLDGSRAYDILFGKQLGLRRQILLVARAKVG